MTGEKLKRYFDFSSVDKNRMNGVCKLCNGNYKDLNGIYSNFFKHLKRKHLSEYQQNIARTDEDMPEEINTLSDDILPVDLTSAKNKQSRISLSIAKNLIIKCNLPLNLIENPAFRDFMKECNSKWEPMSAKKLKHDVISSFKNRIHKIIYEILQNVKDLTLTIDGWSDRRGRGFLGVTCHFIDETMVPQAFLLDFLRMKSPHTSDNIQRLTEYVLDRFNIKEKVFRIITDNASSMIRAYKFGLSDTGEHEINGDHSDKSISVGDSTFDDYDQNFDLNEFQSLNIQQDKVVNDREGFSQVRMSCFAHTLQLSIRDGLQKAPHISKVLEKCQTFARSSHTSSKIADLLDQLNKHIEKATVTRWNSEFMLIKSILSMSKDDLESIAILMENPIRFSNSDFIIMEEIVDVLEPFYQISIKCQAEKVVTISLVVPSIVHLISHLRTIKDNLSFCNKLVEQLQYSIEWRFAGIINRLNQKNVKDDDPFNDTLYFMVALLDPAFKFFWIYDLKLPANTENRLKQNVIQFVLDEISKDSKHSPTESNDAVNSSSTTSSSLLSSIPKVKRRKLFVYDDYRYSNNSSNDQRPLDPSVELEAYLNDPIRSSFSDYWLRSRLSSLKKLVVRLFSVQASSAPIERVFSHAGIIFSTRRTRMTEQLFKDLVFLKGNQSLL